MLLYQILAFTIHGKIYKSHTKIINLKISAPTWNEDLPDESYSVSNTQDYFEHIF